jgi:hypothetical protein
MVARAPGLSAQIATGIVLFFMKTHALAISLAVCCERLAYASPIDRLWRKQRKIESRLLAGEIKPKGMRWQTYNGLIGRINDTEEKRDVQFFARLATLLLRTGMCSKDLFT